MTNKKLLNILNSYNYELKFKISNSGIVDFIVYPIIPVKYIKVSVLITPQGVEFKDC